MYSVRRVVRKLSRLKATGKGYFDASRVVELQEAPRVSPPASPLVTVSPLQVRPRRPTPTTELSVACSVMYLLRIVIVFMILFISSFWVIYLFLFFFFIFFVFLTC
jgi:hypothetical protein